MSRVGRQPIAVPERVKVDIDGTHVIVRGPKGELSRDVSPEMSLHLEGGQLLVSRPSDAPRHRALHGLTRSLLANMVTGVDTGFTKTLEIYGLGYRAERGGTSSCSASASPTPSRYRPRRASPWRRTGPTASTSAAATRRWWDR